MKTLTEGDIQERGDASNNGKTNWFKKKKDYISELSMTSQNIIIEGKFKNNYISQILGGIFFHVLTALKSECILYIAIGSVLLLAAHTHKKSLESM